MKNYFFCYNLKVSQHLKANNIPLITVAQDLKTKKVFSLYEITPQLQSALDEYKALSK
ncbi:hypothetical protein ABEP00_20210 [Heyndrickxia sporothermodurans]|uniref:hypothetical protein n=1 Tax=Heyndrickxia sporothermodurans TaxID=46224 RepID=UPI003D24F3ED